MIPFINSNGRRSLRIPALSGGVNKRDGVSLIQDNQLNEVLNMWYKDGLLKTRPSLHFNGNSETRLLSIDGAEVLDVKVFDEIRLTASSQYLNDSLCTFLVIKYKSKGKYFLQPWLLFFEDTDLKLESVSCDEDVSFFAYAFGKDIYMFVSGENVKKIYKFDTHGRQTVITDEDMYAPLVMTNGKPCVQGGDQIYGYNLLTGYYKAEYSMVDLDEEENLLFFNLVHPVKNTNENKALNYALNKRVKAEYTNINGETFTHEVIINENGNGQESTSGEDNLCMSVYDNQVRFFEFNDNGIGTSVKITKNEFVKNNLVITAPGPYDEAQKKKIFDMTTAVWFGGSAYGMHGGSRLFLGGNKNGDEQALIVWSDLNNPLYFSENNYTYVGNKAQGIVAFGRQDASLVILKEHEIYATQYQANDSVTSEDLMNQTVVDLSTQMAYFPMTQIHSRIGCDSADSVQVCKNRLVWRYNNKVYSLTNQSQYNEKNVFSVSEMVGTLEGEECLSADCFGHYLLFSGEKAYVMDYNSYGYNYVASYQKNEDANVKIPWYIWEFSFTPVAVVQGLNSWLGLIRSIKSGNHAVVDVVSMEERTEGYDYLADVNGVYYTESIISPIKSYLRSKLYDFGLPSHFKTVNLVNITFGNNHGEVINTRFISEADTYDEHTTRLVESEKDMRSPKHLNCKRFMPSTRAITRFGFEVECEGELSIEAVTLEYRMLGGAR